MGVWVDCFVGPESGQVLSREAFEALVVDLIRERIVDPPCALLTGPLEPDMPLGLSNAAALRGKRRYHGGRSADLLAALRALRWGQEDVAVCFDHLAWSNPEVREALEGEGWANGAVVLYALRERSPARLADCISGVEAEPLHLAADLAVTGKNGPTDLRWAPIGPVLERHFGAALVSGCTFS